MTYLMPGHDDMQVMHWHQRTQLAHLKHFSSHAELSLSCWSWELQDALLFHLQCIHRVQEEVNSRLHCNCSAPTHDAIRHCRLGIVSLAPVGSMLWNIAILACSCASAATSFCVKRSCFTACCLLLQSSFLASLYTDKACLVGEIMTCSFVDDPAKRLLSARAVLCRNQDCG